MTLYLESIRIQDGVVQNYDYHLVRARESCRGFVFPSIVELEDCNPYPIGRVKCRVVYGCCGVLSVEYFRYEFPIIRSLSLVDGGDIDYSRKYYDRCALDFLYGCRGLSDDILISRGGMVTDSYFCNLVFSCRGGRLYTPSSPLLSGVKRQELLDSGLVSVSSISVDDLCGFEFVYLVNSMLDLGDVCPIPISSCGF